MLKKVKKQGQSRFSLFIKEDTQEEESKRRSEREKVSWAVCLDSEKGQSAVKGFDITGVKIADGVSRGMLLLSPSLQAAQSKQKLFLVCNVLGRSSHQCGTA